MVRLEALSDLVVLAQPSAWRSLGNRFSGEYLQWRQEDVLGILILALVLVGGYWLLRGLASWQASRSEKHSPAMLSKELAVAHGLTYRERQVCRDVAKMRGYDDPAELFIRIDARELLAAKDARLAKRLFGSSA